MESRFWLLTGTLLQVLFLGGCNFGGPKSSRKVASVKSGKATYERASEKDGLSLSSDSALLMSVNEESKSARFLIEDHDGVIADVSFERFDEEQIQQFRNHLEGSSEELRTELKRIRPSHIDQVGCLYTEGIASDCTEEKLTISDIQRMLQTSSNKEEFLKNFPKNKVSKFTLVYDSKSQQFASEEFPRVIRFSTDADFFMAYSGDKSEHVELIFFDHKAEEYKFGLIDFKAQPKLNTDIKQMNCLSCHQANGRSTPGVIWASYETWPGVVGSKDDNVSIESDVPKWKENMHKEYKILQAVKAQSSNPAYSTLPWAKGSSTYPYTEEFKPLNYWFRPNAHFSVSSSIRRAQIIGRKILDSEFYEKYKWAHMHHYFECGSMEGEPDSDVTIAIDRYIENELCVNPSMTVKDKSAKRVGYSFEYTHFSKERKIHGLRSSIHDYNSWELLNVDSQTYLLSRLAGLSDGDWNLSIFDDSRHNRNRPEYQNGVLPMRVHVDGYLFNHFVDNDLGLSLETVEYTNRFSRMFGARFQCTEDPALTPIEVPEQLRAQGCEIIRKRLTPELFQLSGKKCESTETIVATRYNERERRYSASSTQEVLLKNCVSCHASPDDAETPKIDFEDADALISYTLSSGVDAEVLEAIIQDGSMPPKKVLSDIEKQELIEYFHKVLD